MAAVTAGDHESAPSFPQTRPTLYTSFLEVGGWCFSTFPPFTPRPCWSAVGCRSPGRGGGVLTRGYKSSERGVTASFLFLPIPRWKSRYPQLALGRGWIRQGTKAVIGSLNMINPTLIRKNPRVLCLFAAGQTGQRALSPTLERSCECVCVWNLIKVQACVGF